MKRYFNLSVLNKLANDLVNFTSQSSLPLMLDFNKGKHSYNCIYFGNQSSGMYVKIHTFSAKDNLDTLQMFVETPFLSISGKPSDFVYDIGTLELSLYNAKAGCLTSLNIISLVNNFSGASF